MRDAFPQSAAFHTDHDLLRFLRAREFNRKATWAMYQHYITMVRAQPTPSSGSSYPCIAGGVRRSAVRGMVPSPCRSLQHVAETSPV